ncbi:hypothetical protein JSE7799_03054 [Jannaschia seosinensis]|uniref:Uncharacterized protein n=1 Tax=Jannaschia seosinensis TaxID=313367 RepID=A0A0M7BEV7_9RHOB|nr:hypothetical protein [Jannaschia seosinensis]CUH40322.1 hypothetical protein JSE7799_03054 [Jannaschia seosinensis]
MKFRATIGILAGEFASQQLAFAHLLDVCPEADLDQVEVVARPFKTRLAHWFGTDLPDLPEGSGDVLVLTFPGSGVPQEPTARLRPVGRFTGTLTRAVLPEDG